MEFRPESTRIDTLVFEVRDVVRPLAEKKNLKLTMDVPMDLTASPRDLYRKVRDRTTIDKSGILPNHAPLTIGPTHGYGWRLKVISW